MRSTLIAGVVAALIVFGSGCSTAVYDSRADFEYRVANLRTVRFDQLKDAQNPAATITLNQVTYSSLSADGVVFEPTPGGKLGVMDAQHGSFDAGKAGSLLLTAGGDQRVRVKLPANTYSVGFYVYNTGAAGSGPAPAVVFSQEGAHDVRVPVVGTGAPGPQFVGVVNFKPISSVSWEASASGAKSGIADFAFETR